jgi:PAS domain S-box-containing protein
MVEMSHENWLELLPEAALLVDAHARVLTGNRQAVALLGSDGAGRTLSPPLSLSLSPLSLSLGELAGFREWLAGAGTETFRARLHARRPTGVPLTVELSARRLSDGASGAVCLVVEPDRERVASEAQRYFDIAFDAAPIGMALFNTDGEYVRVNSALCRLLGRSESDLLGHRDQEFTFPDDRQTDIDAAWRILRGEISVWQTEKRFVRPDGRIVWAIANMTFLRDEDGNPISWVGQFQDISARKRDEKALEEAMSLLAATIDATADGLLVVDPAGRIRSYNHCFAEMWRLPESLLLAGDDGTLLASVLSQVIDPEAFLAKVEALYQEPEAESDDIIEFLDGRVFERTSKPQRVGGRVVGRVWSFHDATERRRLEADVATALTQAREASRLKSAFLATMSHEIRTPMNGVLGLAELLLDTTLDATQRSQLMALRESGQTLMALINDILDFSKIEAGKLDLEHVEFDLPGAVGSVARIISSQAHDKGLVLRLKLAPDVPATVSGDSLRLRQVLLNLASNAIKFTDAGGVTISVNTRRDGRLRFSVADTGIGIDPAVRHILLDPFSQADSSTTRRFGGTGLGLAICAQLVELMGGTLEFDSLVGAGSTFWFDVPLRASDRSQAPPAAEPVPAPAAFAGSFAGTRVLLADDTGINRVVGVAMLERLGCVVDVVTNGAEAVEAVGRNRYDAVLMDCLMPVMDGYEATTRIRRGEAGPDRTRIIALTASAMVGDREKCLAAGMDDYLSKPLDQSALAGALARGRARV